MKLKKYRSKRNFKKTTEPVGKISRSKKRLYVIQKHAASHLHYDFRLELNGVLVSWAVPKGPCLDPTIKRLAVHVEDHPIEYGSFEGIIPKGQYGGGTVMLWDRGRWIPNDKDPALAYQKGDLNFTLEGKKLNGQWKLLRIYQDDKTWLLIKKKDKYAKSLKQYDVLTEKPNSVLTQKTINEIAESQSTARKNTLTKKTCQHKQPAKSAINKLLSKLKSAPMPKMISPQLATLVDQPPTGKQWLHEIKLDGYRILAYKKGDRVQLFTRNHKDWTNKFKMVADAVRQLPIENAILDGEIAVLDENQHTNFQLLQNAIKDQNKPFIYYLFDLAYINKYDLSALPLIKRKKMLHLLVPSAEGDILRYNDHIVGSGKEVFKKSCELALEGIVSKEANSPYLQKRSRNWLKIKCLKRQEFIIGGFKAPQGHRQYFGSLFLGAYNKRHELIFHGNVGTGFTQSSLKTIHDLLVKYKTKEMPFKKRPPESKNATWVKPVLIAEIEFTEWTEDGLLRQPRFKGLRSDKLAREITIEPELIIDNLSPSQQATAEKNTQKTFKLTNPNKILYQEDKITKQDLADYYDQISEWMLPHIINRPLTLVRCPDNYRDCFYQKHLPSGVPPSLYEVIIKEKKGKEKHFYIKDKQGLLTLIQLGALEIHPWGCKVDDIEYPDIITFDLDPAPDVPWKRVVAAAFEIKEHLSKFKLKCFVKATGGKGLHIVIPIKPEYSWEEVKTFSQVFADFMVMNDPMNYISKMGKAKRKGKIFIDYLRNQRGATAIAPYSTRARKHAPVAVPLDWDHLTADRKDTVYTLKTLPAHLQSLRKDPWKNFLKLHQSLHLDELE